MQENEALQASVSELKDEQQNKQQKITDQNKAIKLLLDKIQEFEKQEEKLKSYITTLIKEKKTVEKSIQQFRKIIEGNEATIAKLETTIQNNALEIERLKNRKWYQKLLKR